MCGWNSNREPEIRTGNCQGPVREGEGSAHPRAKSVVSESLCPRGPLPVGCSRRECWSGLPFPSPCVPLDMYSLLYHIAQYTFKVHRSYALGRWINAVVGWNQFR